MGVELQRHVDRLLQRPEQLVGVVGREQAGHVLDAQAVGAEADQRPRTPDVVVEIVDRPAELALLGDRVAYRRLQVLARPLDRPRGRRDVALVVQGVEDPEHVNARVGGTLHERLDHVVGVVAVADERLAAKEHRQRRVGNQTLERAQPLPRVLGEKARGRVESGAAPNLHGVKADGAHVGRDRLHVLDAEAGRDQALVAVAEGGIGDLDRVHREGQLCTWG